MKWRYLILLILALFIVSSCAQQPPPWYSPTPIPTLPAIPYEEILTSRFGISNVDQDFGGVAGLGIRWTKPPARGAFSWGLIEPERGEYIWQWTDTYVQQIQGLKMAFLAVIWPFAAWDQANWGPVAATTPLVWEHCLGRSR